MGTLFESLVVVAKGCGLSGLHSVELVPHSVVVAQRHDTVAGLVVELATLSCSHCGSPFVLHSVVVTVGAPLWYTQL